MKKLILFLALACAVNLFAQKPIELPVWPGGAPNSNHLPEDKSYDPILFVYPAQNPNGMAILMCPGGGYTHLAMNHEGHDMASWFNTQGITYIILKYRMPNGNNEVPLSDAQQAMRILRTRAADWQIDPNRIGVMGASAGGHLASTLATHYSSEETRPDFQILLYPVITMDAEYTHAGSRNNLIGVSPDTSLTEAYSNELRVNEKTPQAFIVLSSDDGAVPAENALRYYRSLLKYGIPTSFHAYPTGGHGWGFRDNFTYKRQWTGELEKWLREGLRF